jgi:hypothetical protein
MSASGFEVKVRTLVAEGLHDGKTASHAFGCQQMLRYLDREWGICSKVVSRTGARVPMTAGAILAPVAMFWLSRVHEHSHYLTDVCLPLLVFAATAGLIFVPLTMTLVAGIADEHSGVASSMFNAGQQVGGAVGLAVIGSVAWSVVSDHVRSSLSRASAGHAKRPPRQAARSTITPCPLG